MAESKILSVSGVLNGSSKYLGVESVLITSSLSVVRPHVVEDAFHLESRVFVVAGSRSAKH